MFKKLWCSKFMLLKNPQIRYPDSSDAMVDIVIRDTSVLVKPASYPYPVSFTPGCVNVQDFYNNS